MLLKCPFESPEINLTLELFLSKLESILKNQLTAVYLHGSAVFEDLAPGYGDFDFLAVVGEDLSHEVQEKLLDFRKVLRSSNLGIYARMLEGEFLSRRMLKKGVKGRGVYWGTREERRSEESSLDGFSMLVLITRGMLVYGTDIRNEISYVPLAELINSVRHHIKNIRENSRSTDGGVHSVEWLLMASRMLLWVKEGKLSSKSEAASWAYENCTGGWKKLLPQAVKIRKNPSLASDSEAKEWLKSLGPPAQEACDELEKELILRGYTK
ncbi:MAG: aminoglycoside adenylyltransferase domain-containing protein [Bacillota bacterium]